MSKKYLSIEEAAEQLGIPASELNRLREKGMIRAFADRGTWKFKEEDVEKLGRSRQATSDPEVPLMPAKEAGSSSDLFADEDVLGDQPTIIRKGGADSGSDSDVRLIFDDSMNVAEAKAGTPKDDSDSDVKLAGTAPATPADDSDSDVKLAGSASTPPTPVPLGGSDSDVKLFTDDQPTKEGSDSDVRLVSSDSSNEVQLAGSSAVMPVVGDEDDATIVVNPAESSAIDDESGISLGEGSGIALASDSGISLERPNDSGISLTDDSSLVLTDDSGISLAGDQPPSGKGSGISLGQQPPSDKKKKKDLAKAAADSDDLSGTVPLMDSPLADDDLLETQEVPSLDDSDESGDVLGGEGDSTNVITLDDDEAGYDVTSEVPRGAAALEEEEEAAVEEEEAVDVADDLVGEDDELAEDVFGAEDEDFAGEEVESGESLGELPVAPRGMVAAAEQDWGVGTHTALIISAALMVACGTVLFDMVRNMWHTDAANHNPVASALLDMFAGK
ncbi:MAG: helix-turn-helix domain-containing protein [Deltaproteobacteria bacterium]